MLLGAVALSACNPDRGGGKTGLVAKPVIYLYWEGVDGFESDKALDEEVNIEPQTLTSPERNGFVLVEWGGTEIK